MTALAIYFILTAAHRWEFVAIDPGPSAALACEALKANVASIFTDTPGNMRIACVPSEEGAEA